MTYTDPATPITGTPITIAFYLTNIGDNIRHLRANTGAGDPGAANRAIISTGASTTAWSTIPDAAMTNPKVSKGGDSMSGTLLMNGILEMANVIVMQSGKMIGWPSENAVKEDYTGGATPGASSYLRGVTTNVLYDQSARDFAWIKSGVGNLMVLAGTNATTPSLTLGTLGHTVWHSGNDGSGSGLDANLLNGLAMGHSANQIPWNESGVLNAGLRCQYAETLFNGSIHVALGNGNGNVAWNNGTVNTNLNADMVDGVHAGNSNGNVALANGTVVTNLNADMVDGAHGPFLPLGGGTMTGAITFTTLSPAAAGSVTDARYQFGNANTGWYGDPSGLGLTLVGQNAATVDSSRNWTFGPSPPAGSERVRIDGGVRGTAAYTNASTRRLKVEIEEFDAASVVPAIASLKAFRYRRRQWDQDREIEPTGLQLGLVTETVPKPLRPWLLTPDGDAVDTYAYSTLLLMAYQSLASRVEKLEAAR